MDMRSREHYRSGNLLSRLITLFVKQVQVTKPGNFSPILVIVDGCDQCFLKNNMTSLKSHFNDAIKTHGAEHKDIVFILSQDAHDATSRTSEAMAITSFLNQTFPGIDIKFDDDFEGMEKMVVFSLTNGSIGSTPSIIPLSLTRANNHLVMFIEDFRDIFISATRENLVKMSQHDLPPAQKAENLDTKAPKGLQEAADILASLAREMPVESFARLADEWGLKDMYQKMVIQNKTRWQMTKSMTQKLMENCCLSLAEFMESLTLVNMRDPVARKLEANLTDSTEDLKTRIVSMNLTDNEQIALAHSLGQRSLFNCLTRPQDPAVSAMSDQEALICCVDTWRNEAKELTSNDELINCLLKAGLTSIGAQIKEKLETLTVDDDIKSFANMSMKKKIETTAFNVFLPVVSIIVTAIFMILLYCSSLQAQFWVLLLVHWVPGAGFFSIHLYYNQIFYGPILNKFYMALLLLFQLIGSTILYIHYIMQRFSSTGGAVERYKIKKILQLAESSMLMNNFTSLAIATYALQMLNEGRLSMTQPALFTFFTITVGIHCMKLVVNIVKKQAHSGFSRFSTIEIFPIISSLMLKVVATSVLLSSNTNYVILYSCLTVILALMFNYWIEKKLVSEADVEEQEINMTWMKATHSLIFPLEPQLPTRRAQLGVSLQLLVGDLAAAAGGFTPALWMGVTEGLFLTDNMVQALSLTGVGMVLYSVLALSATSLWTTSTSLELDDELEEPDEDATETSPILGIPSVPEVSSDKKKSFCTLLLPVLLLLLLASPGPLLLFVFNSCPAFPSLPHTSISCSSSLVVGSQCQLSCSPLLWSSSSLHSQCTWRGVWTVKNLTCRQQAAVLVGLATPLHPVNWQSAAQVYKTRGISSLLPPLPRGRLDGFVGYINGGLLYCGGVDTTDQASLPVGSCSFLKSPLLGWQETYPLLQVTHRLSCSFSSWIFRQEGSWVPAQS